ncbi:flagellar hook-length control protein FliK [Sulfuricella denitrificans]|uniref:flagellar hook-length control protein FliK n=1 Tax=Sulfuricella denitrificans TaxID=649841 RepID=UPI0002889A6C|nr:flagellar hook-length control protein FliK [Sulfuricella denitrificans]
MIHNDVLNQLQLLIKTSAPPLIDVAQTPLEEAQWVPGQRLSAVVLASLPNGRFQVQVGDASLDMNLPRNTQPGDKVELTFVSNQPRLTFALTRDLPSAAGNNLAAGAKPQVSLSDSVRYLGALLQKISDQSETQAAPLNKTAPLLSAAPSDIKDFAASLRNALSQSGLFYESHQAQWVAGERRLTDLMQEPQGKLPVLIPGSGAEVAQKNAPALMQSEGLLAQSASRMPVHAEAVTLVQQQLQTLDSRQLIWQGQVWQGQPMEWRVEERGAREGGVGEAEMPHWQTSLRLQLPRLGDVQASLAFTQQGLRVELKAVDAGTAEAMRGAQDRLRNSMEAAGLNVLAMSVERHEKT